MQRKILHIDMDAFYASVEQRDNPELRGKPVIVGGLPEGRGGVVATASYEARKFGVRSAMPSKKALELCPDGIFVKPRFDVYKQLSNSVREIFSRYTDLIEPLSLDEAYLDVTQDKLGLGSAITIAEQIREAIRSELHLTASAGVSVNKFVAKIASDMKKPDGLTFIGPSRIETFMEELPVDKFYGVGKVTAAKMRSLGLNRGADLKAWPEERLTFHFGKIGSFFYQIVRGIDNREVQPHRQIKSVGAEDTFPEDLFTEQEMQIKIEPLIQTVHRRLSQKQLKGRTITLKMKYQDFKLITRSRTLGVYTNEQEIIQKTITELLAALLPVEKGVRLIGVSVSNFYGNEQAGTEPGDKQLTLF